MTNPSLFSILAFRGGNLYPRVIDKIQTNTENFYFIFNFIQILFVYCVYISVSVCLCLGGGGMYANMHV